MPSLHLGPLRWSARRARYVRQLLAAAGVELPAGDAAEPQGQTQTHDEAQPAQTPKEQNGERERDRDGDSAARVAGV